MTGRTLDEPQKGGPKNDLSTSASEVADGDHTSIIISGRRLVRKIDLNLMPLMFVSYMLQYMDKSSLNYSSIMGIREDANLVGQDYSWLSSGFYLGYLVCSYPATLAFVKLPIGKFLAGTIVLWSIVLACHAAPSGFAGLMVLRVLLGASESAISPGFSLMTSMWYVPLEHTTRHAIWSAGNAVGNIFGGLIAYGIAQIKGPIEPWRWLFIILGLITLSWGCFLLRQLPDSPATARFLNPEEKQEALHRIDRIQHSTNDGKYEWNQVKEAVTDVKSWIYVLFMFCNCIPAAAGSNFSSIIIHSFDFNVLQTLLMSIPNSALLLVVYLAVVLTVQRFPNSRCICMALCCTVTVGGTLLIMKLPQSNRVGKLFGVFLLSTSSTSFPLLLSLVQSNTAGYTKKSVVNAMVFLSYCVGNISGPQFFKASEAPTYDTAYTAMLICTCFCVALIMTYWAYCRWENSRRNNAHGVRQATESESLSEDRIPERSNLTDFEQKATYRYIV